MGRSRVVAALGVSAIVAAGAILWAVDPGGGTVPAAASATTSTTRPTTTIPAAGTGTTIATSNVAELTVYQRLPADAATAPAVPLTATATWPAYSPERAGAPEIPSLVEGVDGRFRTPDGWAFANPDSFGAAPVFGVVERRGDWLAVVLPVRPNGTRGWVRASDVTLSSTGYRVEVSVSGRRLRLFDGARVVTDVAVVVGRPATPTPTGHLFVTDSIDRPAGSVYGPGILPLSAFSQALDHFDDGVPVIALHGTNRPDRLGTAASNGCIRVDNATIAMLRSTLPLGTPVDVVP